MNIDEVYSNYVASPNDQTSGDLYLALVEQAKKTSRTVLNPKKVGDIEEVIYDAAQDLWKKIAVDKLVIKQTARFGTFADTVFHNYFIDWRKKGSRAVSLDDPDYCLPADIEAVEDHRIEKIDLKATLERLHNTTQLAIVTMKQAGLTEQEIADHLDVSRPTISRHWKEILDICQNSDIDAEDF